MKFENSIIIERPRKEVFTYLAQLENIPAWNYAIEEVTATSSGPIHIGSTYKQIRRLPQPSVETLTVTELRANELLSLKGGFGPVAGTIRYKLASTSQGGTLLTNDADLTAPGVLGALSGLWGVRIKHAVAENLDTLKHILES